MTSQGAKSILITLPSEGYQKTVSQNIGLASVLRSPGHGSSGGVTGRKWPFLGFIGRSACPRKLRSASWFSQICLRASPDPSICRIAQFDLPPRRRILARTLKISSATGSGMTKVSASEETHSINPALASKMTGKALMTRGSDIFQFFSQFFGSILKWRDVVPQQQVEKFRARDA